MSKGGLTTATVLTVLALTLGAGAIETWEQKKAPLWLTAICSLSISAIVYATFKAAKNGDK